MGRWAHVVDGMVRNVALWDGVAPWDPGGGSLVELVEGSRVGPGWSYDGAEFTEPVVAEVVPDDWRTALLEEVAQEKARRIAAGFTFRGARFGLSEQMRVDLLGLQVLGGMLSWPYTVRSDDRLTEVVLADRTEGGQFVGTALSAYDAIVRAARVAEDAVAEAADYTSARAAIADWLAGS